MSKTLASESIQSMAVNTDEYNYLVITAPFSNDDGSLDKVIEVIMDVTSSKRMEKRLVESEKMLKIGSMAAGIAHEVRNPISGMMQSAQLIRERLGNIKMKANVEAAERAGTTMDAIRAFMEDRGILAALDNIQKSGIRGNETISNVLNFSSTSNEEFIPVEISDVLDRCIEIVGIKYAQQDVDYGDINIIRHYEMDLPLVPAKESELQQVIINLLYNGADAMRDNPPERPPQFIIRTLSKGSYLCIEISDNGHGIDEVVQRKIFNPFFTTKEKGKGTGLGLSLSSFIIHNNHKGNLEFESGPGEGATFYIYLPLSR